MTTIITTTCIALHILPPQAIGVVVYRECDEIVYLVLYTRHITVAGILLVKPSVRRRQPGIPIRPGIQGMRGQRCSTACKACVIVSMLSPPHPPRFASRRRPLLRPPVPACTLPLVLPKNCETPAKLRQRAQGFHPGGAHDPQGYFRGFGSLINTFHGRPSESGGWSKHRAWGGCCRTGGKACLGFPGVCECYRAQGALLPLSYRNGGWGLGALDRCIISELLLRRMSTLRAERLRQYAHVQYTVYIESSIYRYVMWLRG